MAGQREDGTFAEDKAHHPARRVDKPDWSSLTDAEHGFATIFNRNTPAHVIKQKYAERGMDQV